MPDNPKKTKKKLAEKPSAKGCAKFPYQGVIKSLGFSPNGKKFAIGYEYGEPQDKLIMKLNVCSAATGKLIRTFDCPGLHAFSPNSRDIAVLKAGIELFNIKNGDELSRIHVNFDYVHSFCFSPNGKLIAAAGAYETEEYSDFSTPSLGVWDAKTGKNIWEKRVGRCWKVCFSPDGKELHVVEEGHDLHHTSRVSAFAVATGERMELAGAGRHLRAEGLRLYDIGLSPDGRKLVAGGDLNAPGRPNHVHVWSLPDGREYRKLAGHTGVVTRVLFSPDGRLAAASSLDRTTRLWNVRSGRQLHEFRLGAYGGLAFSPDGKTLVIGGARELLLYDVTTGKRSFGWSASP